MQALNDYRDAIALCMHAAQNGFEIPGEERPDSGNHEFFSPRPTAGTPTHPNA